MELLMMEFLKNVYLVIFNVRVVAYQHQIACNAWVIEYYRKDVPVQMAVIRMDNKRFVRNVQINVKHV
jgi:hypothetical protein